MSGTSGEARHAVVITGAGSGIGQATAVALSNAGWRVFAATHRAAAPDTWQGGRPELISPLELDVTNPAAVRQAAETVRTTLTAEGLTGLAALVNSAGTALAGPLEFLAPEAIEHQLQVNVVGQLAVTQAFLPLIRQGRGRIVNVGSLSGRQALPFMGPYAASKFALRALNDALRVELLPWDIPVVLIEAGTVATGIWAKGAAEADRQMAGFPPAAERLYGRTLAGFKERAVRIGEAGLPVEQVVEAITLALTLRHPAPRYVVAPGARVWMTRLLGVLPVRLRDRLVVRALR